MRYEDIPSLRVWQGDTYAIHFAKPLNPIVVKIDNLLENYQKAFTPMAKRNLTADLEKCCIAWKSSKPMIPAMEALLEVTHRHMKSSLWAEHPYEEIVCIGYAVQTGELEEMGRGKTPVYKGKLDDKSDMTDRVHNMKIAINQAHAYLDNKIKNDSKILKLFMAPEFYFRGLYGAYPPKIVSQILPLLRNGTDGTDRAFFQDWMFVFGTAISASIDEREYCKICKSASCITYVRDPANPAKTIATCKNGAKHDVGKGILGAVIDNIALIQKNKDEYYVTKEYISGVDFRREMGAWGDYVNIYDEGTRKKMSPMPTYGSRDTSTPVKIASTYDDEKMGGCVFNMEGISFGMEICLDHLKKRLDQVQNLQIVLIPSAGMSIMYDNTIKNGITFNVDGEYGESMVKINTGTGIFPKPKSTFKLVGIPGNIHIYDPLKIPY